jgi:hypothetical protein
MSKRKPIKFNILTGKKISDILDQENMFGKYYTSKDISNIIADYADYDILYYFRAEDNSIGYSINHIPNDSRSPSFKRQFPIQEYIVYTNPDATRSYSYLYMLQARHQYVDDIYSNIVVCDGCTDDDVLSFYKNYIYDNLEGLFGDVYPRIINKIKIDRLPETGIPSILY